MFKRFVQNSKNLISSESSSILSAAIVIMGATLGSALLGVIRTRLLIQYFFDNKAVVDVFWAAFRLPDMVFQILIVGALSSAFIPIFTKYHEKESDDAANSLASSIINIVVGITIILSILIFYYAVPLSRFIAGGFDPDQIELMAKLTRIMAVAQVFFGFSSFLTGIIQSRKRFLVPALSPILYNFGIIIGTVTLSSTFGIAGPAIGVVIGAILHLCVQLPTAYHLGFRYKFIIQKSVAILEMWRLMFPRMLTLSLSQIEATAIVAFSSWLSLGSVTVMSIAAQLANLPIRLIGVTIGQAALPFFSKETAKNNLSGLATMVSDTILQMLYLALPASAILLVLRIPLVRLAYGADSFPWAETVTTGRIVAMLALGITARSLTHVLIRVYYSLHDTVTPLVVNIISTTINVGLSYYLLFVVQTGIIGMALAITIAATLETIVLTVMLFSMAKFSLQYLLIPLGKMSFVTALTTVALWAPLRILDQLIFDTTRTVPLIALTLTVTVIGLAVYLTLSYLFNIRELATFISLVKKIGNWQKSLFASPEPIESQESNV